MGEIRRIYVEKKSEFAVEAKGLLADLQNNLGLGSPVSYTHLDVYKRQGDTFGFLTQCGEVIFLSIAFCLLQ